MKRCIVLLFCLVLMFSLTVPAFAVELPSTIPEDLLPDTPVFIYSGNLVLAFGYMDNRVTANYYYMDRIVITPIAGENSPKKQYAVSDSTGKEVLLALDWDVFRFYLENDLTDYLGDDVVITSKKYYKGMGNTGTAIYYETSKGDYVYFKQEQIKPCLFSADAFQRFMKMVFLRESQRKPWDQWKTVDFRVWPVTGYELDSPDFDPNVMAIPDINPVDHNWPLTILCMLLIVSMVILAVYLIYKFKYAKYQPEENC